MALSLELQSNVLYATTNQKNGYTLVHAISHDCSEVSD